MSAAPRLSMRTALEAQDDLATTFLSVRSDARGLSEEEAARRLRRQGYNRMVMPGLRRRKNVLLELLGQPQVLSLLLLCLVAGLSDSRNLPGALLLLLPVLLAAGGAFVRARRDHAKLRALNELSGTSTTVLRRESPEAEPEWLPVSSAELVRGDIVQLGAGFRVPADVRLIKSRQLHVDQSLLTGDARPARKLAGGRDAPAGSVHSGRFDPPSLPNVCLTGSFVMSGTGTGVVVATGEQTYFGSLARALLHEHGRGAAPGNVPLFLPRLLLLVPVVLMFRAGWGQLQPAGLAWLLLAGVVALFPELFPGALAFRAEPAAPEHAPLSSLSAWLQALGGGGPRRERLADTELVLLECLDGSGRPSPGALRRAWLLSRLNTESRTTLDAAVLSFVAARPDFREETEFELLAEIPYNTRRRRYSMVLAGTLGQHLLLSRGPPEAILQVAGSVRTGSDSVPLSREARQRLQAILREKGTDNHFLQLIGSRLIPPNRAKRLYGPADERELRVEGILVLAAAEEEGRER